MDSYDIRSPGKVTGAYKRPRPGKTPYVPKTYKNPPIPYEVSAPGRFWRISKKSKPAVYWKKRYWRRRITGRGAYVMDPGDSVGRRFGGFIGSKLGEFVGGYGQALITGTGAYTIKKNVMMDGNLPQMVNMPSGGGTIIRFQEYLGDVISGGTLTAGSSVFDVQSYLINAANPATFPFLSQIASNYEQYEIEGMIFQFRSTSANALNSTNTALGTVIMGTQYDVADAPFASKSEMLNHQYSVSVKPSDSTLHMIECAPNQTTTSLLYTLSSEQTPAGQDSRFYHLGRFSIATQGFQAANVVIGELHVTYQVRLLKPKLSDLLGNNFLSTYITTTGYSSALPLGSAVQLTPNSFNNACTLDLPNRSLSFPNASVGYFRILITWNGTTGVGFQGPGIQSCTNGAPQFNIGAIPLCYPQNGTGGSGITQCAIAFGLKTSGNGDACVLKLDGFGALPTGGIYPSNFCVIRVTQTNSATGAF
ncbi:capsid protein [Crucivirus-195]|nr:capsid protein [Crucivirus-195]